ncbi:salicylate 1-monooxygenase [Fusarium coicis]|nr:salicylate 1-monooxygenase [Fusarium coicis]
MAQDQKDFQTAIIGGGIAGIVLAISLLKRNIPCKIYERAHAFSDIGAGLSEDWPSETQLVLPATKEDLLQDFEGFRPSVLKVLDNTEKLDRWAIFDLGDNPVPAFAKGRVRIIGDAAHASSPHHGAGASLCIEDAAMLASILVHGTVRQGADVGAAFSAFDRCRTERCQWAVQKSRRAAQLFERQTENGSDFGKIFEELRETLLTIWDYDIEQVVKTANRRIINRPRNIMVPNERSEININTILSQLFNLSATIPQKVPYVIASVGAEITSTTARAGGQLLGGCFIILGNGMKAAESADPPRKMKDFTVFQAVLAMAMIPLPLMLGMFGRSDQVALKRTNVHQNM